MKSTPEATNFIMFQPDNGRTIPENKKTIVKVIYDNDAIYVAALLYDDEPDKIRRDFTTGQVYQTFLAFLSMALMMVSKISNFCQRC
jgi:hypothetical protein